MTPKWPQNGTKKDPKTIPESNQKRCRQSASKVRQKGTKNDCKKNPKIKKNRFGCPFFQLKKRSLSQNCFFSFFILSGRPWTLEIKPKRYNGVQKRGCQLFVLKPFFFYKNYLEMTPLGTPKGSRKPTKRENKPFRNGAPKRHGKTTEQNPTGSRQTEFVTLPPPDLLPFHKTNFPPQRPSLQKRFPSSASPSKRGHQAAKDHAVACVLLPLL